MKRFMKSVLACMLAFAMVLTVMPVNAYAANKKAVVVTNQKQLEKALKNGATNIVIKTNKSVKITIPATKKAAKATISVQAKNATITNKASVKAIEIKDAKAFVESGKNNDIKITDDKLSLTVAKSSKGSDIQIAKKDAEIKVVAKGDVASVTVAKTADVTLTVNKTATVASVNVAAKGASVDLNAKGTVSDVKVSEKAADTKLNINASGKVENVQIDAKADVAVAGSTNEAVKVTVNAKDTTIKAETAVDTTLNADTKLDLSKGAEGSTVTTKENVKADVANNTTDTVTVKDSTGKESTVDAGKTETKTDEGKKDEDKKDDQKTDDNSGNVTPAPTPTPTPTPDPTPSEPEGQFDGFNIEGSNLLSVYLLNVNEVLDTFDKSNIEVKSSNGTKIEVTNIKKDGSGYYVTLASDMQDDTYTFVMHYDGKKYVNTYTYNSKAMQMVMEQSKQMVQACSDVEITASQSALQVPTLLEDALLEFLSDKFDNDSFEDYEIILQKVEEANDSQMTALMSISVMKYDEDTQTNIYYEVPCTVKFQCVGENFVAKNPKIKCIFKNTIVVEANAYYQYACVDNQTSLDEIAEEDWTDKTDNSGNIVFGNLDAGTYKVYARYDGSSKLSAFTDNVVLTENAPEAICIAEPREGSKTEFDMKTVNAGAEISFPVEVNTFAYGNIDRNGLYGDMEFVCDDKELNASLYREPWNMREWDDERHCPRIAFTVPLGLKNGDYTVKINYYYACNVIDNDGEWTDKIIAQSEPVTYTIKFHCNEAKDIQLSQPNIKYKLKTSIVVESVEGLEYACVAEGTSINNVSEDAWNNWVDDFGNVEFHNLTSGGKYRVYCRNMNSPSIYNYVDVALDDNLETYILLADAIGETSITATEEVSKGGKIEIPTKIMVRAYGGADEVALHGRMEPADEDTAKVINGYTIQRRDENSEELFISFWVNEQVEAGTYTVKFNYYFELNDIGEDGTANDDVLATSQPIKYTIQFSVQ